MADLKPPLSAEAIGFSFSGMRTGSRGLLHLNKLTQFKGECRWAKILDRWVEGGTFAEIWAGGAERESKNYSPYGLECEQTFFLCQDFLD